MERYTTISKVVRGSIAHLAGIRGGDTLLSVNGVCPGDILEYKYLACDENIELEILKKDGTIEIIDFENPDYEDLGLVFEHPLLSRPKACRNRCIFCFIDQLPKGMRKSLYFKDDDYRLSFLQGNYVTLTNLSEADLCKLTKMRISPLNISVHATDPGLRAFMTGNKNAGNILEVMRRLWASGIVMNCQIVLCRGINDGEALEKTLCDLTAMHPGVNSVSVVPVGLTAHRDGLYSLEPYDAQSAGAVLDMVDYWQRRMLKSGRARVVFAADELYLKAARPIPPLEAYEDFPQLENGVGLIALFEHELQGALKAARGSAAARTVCVATGAAAFGFISGCASQIENKFKDVKIKVYQINNDFFGNNVTVAGLICGRDLIAQLKGRELGDELLLPSVMFRSDGDIMLDGVTPHEIEQSLGVKVRIVPVSGKELLRAALNW